MSPRVAEVVYVGNASDLIRASREAASATELTAGKIEASNTKIGASYGAMVARASEAGKAAAAQAAKLGATLGEQDKAYARAAQAAGLASDKIAAAAKVAGDAAAKQAAAVGGSLDAQRAAYARAATAAGEQAKVSVAAAEKTALANEAAAAKTAAANEKTLASAKHANETFAKMGTVAAAGFAAVGVAGTKMSIDFGRSMLEIRTQAGASQAEVDKMSKAILDLKGVQESPVQLSKALFQLESVGIRGAKALHALRAAADGAAVGHASLTDTTSALASAMTAFHMPAEKAHQIMGVLNAIVGQGRMHMDELVEAMKSGILPTAQAAGVSLESLGASIATLTASGFPAEKATTLLRTALFKLAAPSGGAVEALKAIHLSHDALASAMRGPRGLVGGIELLQSHMSNLTKISQVDVLSKIFSSRSAAVIVGLMGNLDQLRTKFANVQTNSGQFATLVAAQHHSAAGKIANAWSEAQKSLTKAGDAFAPYAAKVAGAVASSLQWFEKHKEAAKALAIVIGTVLGAAVIDFAVSKVAKFGKGIADMVDGLKWLAAKFTATSAVVVAEDGVMVETTQASSLLMKRALLSIPLVALVAAAYELGKHWKEAMQGLEEATQSVANFMIDRFNEIIHKINEFTDKISFGLIPKIHELGHVQIGGSEPSLKKAEEETGRSGTSEAELRRQGLGGLGNAHVTNQKVLVESFAARHGISPSTLWGVYGTETSYGKNISTSSAGAMGAFQFMPETAKEYHYPMTNRPSAKQFEQQADAAAHYLADLIKRFHGNVSKALAAYSGQTPGYAQKVSEGGGYGSQTFAGAEKAGGKLTEAFNKSTGQIEKHTAAGWAHIHALEAQKKAQEKIPSITGWADKMLGHFAESTGANTGPELDKLQNEFHTRAAAWCAEFATTAAMMGGANKAVRTASVETIRQWAQEGSHGYRKGVSHTPQVGAMMMFGNQHVGFVEAVHGSQVTTIEGNTSAGRVVRQTHQASEGDFAMPKYAADTKNLSKTWETVITRESHALNAKLSEDMKAGQTELAKMQSAISSEKLSELVKFTGGVHNAHLAALEGKLSGDHTSALDKLVMKLQQTHASVLEHLRTAIYAQIAKWTETIESLHTKMAELAAKAAQVWQNIESKAMGLRHKEATAPIEGAVKGKRAEDEAEETKHTEEDLAKQLDAAKKNLKEVKATGDKAKTKEAEHEVLRSEEAITRFKRDQDAKRLENEKSGIDEAFNIESEALEERTHAYEAMLNKQLDALTGQLQRAEISYATYGAKVNAILSKAGVAPLTTKELAGMGGEPPIRRENGRVYFANGMWVTDAEYAGGIVPYEAGNVKVGHRKFGGPVREGISYMVGEAGPELFTPSAAGQITPAGKTAELVGSGAHSVVNNFSGPVTMGTRREADQFASRLAFKMRHG